MRGRIIIGKIHEEKGIFPRLQGEVSIIAGEQIQNNLDRIEKIKQGYLKEGLNFFQRIDGSFTLAIEDHIRGEFFLVRDKLGTVPVYYAIHGNGITWGNMISDIPALAQDGFALSVNEDVLHEYFTFRYVSGRNTLFRGVYEVLPGHYLKFDLKNGSIEETKYWEIPYPDHSEILKDDEIRIIEKIEDILIRNIQRSFSNDLCQHGILSSGGIDSSLIVALTSKNINDNLKTFFIGFENYESDRSMDAQMVADNYHAMHTNYYIDAEQYADALPEAIQVNEEPLNHPGHVGRVLFNKSMEGIINALYMGEGVDTIFCGSKAYSLLKYGYKYNLIKPISHMLFSLLSPDVVPNSMKRYYKKIRAVFIMKPDEYMIQSFAEADPLEVNELLEKKNDQRYLDYYKSFVSGYTRDNVLEKYIKLNQHPYMVEVLNSEAKFGSVYGMVNKYPFMDVELLSFANRLPFKLRTRGFTGKYIIKKLAEKYFSRKFIYKRKEGFSVPLKTFFMNPKGMGRFFDLLMDKRTRERGIFKKVEFTKLVERSYKGDMPHESYETLLWTAINLELWFRIFIDRKIVWPR